jgi:RND family efflux transporter MFP subunit
MTMNPPIISSNRHTTTSHTPSREAPAEACKETATTAAINGQETDAFRALQIGTEQRSPGRVNVNRRKHPLLWLMTAILGVGLIGAWAWFGLRAGPIAVRVATVASAQTTGGGILTAGGYVQHARLVNAVARVSGIVATLNVSEGDVVREGDLIATLRAEELEQQVAEYRADLRAAQSRLAELEAGSRREEIEGARAKVEALRLASDRLDRDRARSMRLAEAGAISAQAREEADNESLVARKNLEVALQALALLEAGPRPEAIAAARATVDASQARLARAMSLLERTEIRAPLSGRVLRKFVEVGTMISIALPSTEAFSTLGSGTPIVTIGQLEGLEAVADINQSDLGRLSLREEVEISAEAYPGKVYPAHIARFSPRADRNKNTVEVTVRFDGTAPSELAHDMSVKLSFLGDQAIVGPRDLLIPASAVMNQSDAPAVFVIEDGRLRTRRIIAGPPLPTKQILVKSGLAPGDRVVIANPKALKEGVKVVPQNAAANGGENHE